MTTARLAVSQPHQDFSAGRFVIRTNNVAGWTLRLLAGVEIDGKLAQHRDIVLRQGYSRRGLCCR